MKHFSGACFMFSAHHFLQQLLLRDSVQPHTKIWRSSFAKAYARLLWVVLRIIWC